MKRVIALLMLAALLLSVCACTKQEPSAADETIETKPIEYYKTDVETNEIDTPYGKLNYPAEWVGKVDVTTSEEGGVFRVVFKALYGDVIVPMYDIVFGATPDGFKLGDLSHDGENIEVFCDDYTLEGSKQVPEEFSEDYSIKCEDLNVIISHLVYDHGMTVN